jgi:hypothetical protein
VRRKGFRTTAIQIAFISQARQLLTFPPHPAQPPSRP